MAEVAQQSGTGVSYLAEEIDVNLLQHCLQQFHVEMIDESSREESRFQVLARHDWLMETGKIRLVNLKSEYPWIADLE